MNGTFVFAFTAALNPSLLAATTVMLLLDHPKRLLLGYLLGALMVSITLGLVIVSTLGGSSAATNTTRTTLGPGLELALGLILVVIALAIRPGHESRELDRLADRRRRRAEKKAAKGPPRWQRTLSKGTARATFVVGALQPARRLLPDRPRAHRQDQRQYRRDVSPWSSRSTRSC